MKQQFLTLFNVGQGVAMSEAMENPSPLVISALLALITELTKYFLWKRKNKSS